MRSSASFPFLFTHSTADLCNVREAEQRNGGISDAAIHWRACALPLQDFVKTTVNVNEGELHLPVKLTGS